MNVPRSVADVLSDHVVFEVERIDRMYCNVHITGLQYAAGLVGYIHQQLELPIASTAPLAKITDRFSAAIHRFAVTTRVPVTSPPSAHLATICHTGCTHCRCSVLRCWAQPFSAPAAGGQPDRRPDAPAIRFTFPRLHTAAEANQPEPSLRAGGRSP